MKQSGAIAYLSEGRVPLIFPIGKKRDANAVHRSRSSRSGR